MNVFNHKELEGERVNCLLNGNGEIIETNAGCSTYPVLIQFHDRKDTYKKDGRALQHNVLPTLNFGHKEPRTHNYDKPSTAKKCKRRS